MSGPNRVTRKETREYKYQWFWGSCRCPQCRSRSKGKRKTLRTHRTGK